MKVISVNLGLPRTVQWKGKAVSTAIFKTSVSDRITLRSLNLDGDRQSDLSVHGGQNKAVYAYPAEHYAYWHSEFPDTALPWGMFGENLTTEGLREDALQVGDRLRIGSTEVIVTQPRMPCFKLGLRFGRDDIVKRFLASGHTGFYFRVIIEGEVRAGDPIVLVKLAADSTTISEITRLYARDKDDLKGLRRMLAVGGRIEAKAPAGTFTVDVRQHNQPVVLIGGGIGLTPLVSMLNSIVAAESPRETWVLYGVRDDREHIMRTHLETIARAHPNVHLHVFYSQPAREIDGGDIHVGRIDLGTIQRLIPSKAYDFYVCGPPAMMDSVTRGLQAWGVPADRAMEAFGPATIKRAVRGPAAQPDCGVVAVTFARSGVTTLWSRCESPLLELAEEHSVAIDFGCRAGSCGTCVTRILSGAVRYLHQPNAPLEVDEVLPCISVPAEPIVLDA